MTPSQSQITNLQQQKLNEGLDRTTGGCTKKTTDTMQVHSSHRNRNFGWKGPQEAKSHLFPRSRPLSALC